MSKSEFNEWIKAFEPTREEKQYIKECEATISECNKIGIDPPINYEIMKQILEEGRF